MDTCSVLDLVSDRLSLLLGIPPGEIRGERLFAELGVDSLMILELVAIVEQAIGRQLPEEDIGRFRSIDDVQLYLSERLAG